jgi:hypothetical protein
MYGVTMWTEFKWLKSCYEPRYFPSGWVAGNFFTSCATVSLFWRIMLHSVGYVSTCCGDARGTDDTRYSNWFAFSGGSLAPICVSGVLYCPPPPAPHRGAPWRAAEFVQYSCCNDIIAWTLLCGLRVDGCTATWGSLVTFTSVGKAEIANKMKSVKRIYGLILWNVVTKAHISQFSERINRKLIFFLHSFPSPSVDALGWQDRHRIVLSCFAVLAA